MSSPKSVRNVQERIAALKRQLGRLDYVCSGTLSKRLLPCGKANCRCKAQPPRLHGPYRYWGRMDRGRLVQKLLSVRQAQVVEEAIRNYRMARRVLRRWESETLKIIEAQR